MADRIMKYRLINDIINVVLPPDGVPDVKWNKIVSPDNYGFFELLLDEELATQTDPSSGEIILMTKLFFLHSMEKKSTFLPYHVKKHHSTLEMDTFKIMLLLSYLASLDNKSRT